MSEVTFDKPKKLPIHIKLIVGAAAGIYLI
jgi:hypothetical protein